MTSSVNTTTLVLWYCVGSSSFCKTAHRPKLKNKDPGPDTLCFKGLGLVHVSRLNWADFEPSGAQSADSTTHTY